MVILKMGTGKGVSRITLQMVQDLLNKCVLSMICYVRDLGYHPKRAFCHNKESSFFIRFNYFLISFRYSS